MKLHREEGDEAKEEAARVSRTHLFQGLLLWRSLSVLGDNDEVASVPVNNQLLPLEGKAWATLIWLVKVHTLISCHNELQILGGVTERRAAQPTAMSVQLQVRVIFH